MDQVFDLVAELGFSIAGTIASGYFVFLTLQFILTNVTNSVVSISNIIKRLDSRVEVMTNDLHRIDTRVSQALGLSVDYTRITRSPEVS